MRDVNKFIETALWSTMGYDSEPLDAKFSINDVSDEFKVRCQTLLDKFAELAAPFLTEEDIKREHIEHDLWLTIERHGAGFWDGDYVNGDKLTALAQSLSSDVLSDALNDSIEQEEV